jgi:hypothetical protein
MMALFTSKSWMSQVEILELDSLIVIHDFMPSGESENGAYGITSMYSVVPSVVGVHESVTSVSPPTALRPDGATGVP